MKYVALLRGINVGGNNRVSMVELKECFEQAGFQSVRTYINSGNVLFESSEKDEAKLVIQCEAAVENRVGFHVVCSVVSIEELKDALSHAPTWWGKDSTQKNDAFFVIAPATAKEVMEQVGPATEYEKVAARGPIIFWTAPIKTYSRTRYSKIIGTKVYQSVTVRNMNTTRKLLELSA